MNIPFPLALPGNTFSAGRTYTFRLSCSPKAYPALLSYTDIVLPVNAPPTGGYLQVLPTSGYSLSTIFAMATTGWSTDSDNLPLRYFFSYQLSAFKGALVLSVLSPKPYTTSPLPPGLPSLKYAVSVFGTALDMYGAQASAQEYVTAEPNPNESPTKYLNNVLAKSIASGDLDLTFQTINLVSSAVSTVNCSASPNCSTLHRDSCYFTINTCGSCSSGYYGVSGDSNKKCFSKLNPSGGEGFPCHSNSTCLYGLCQQNVCTTPNKGCQSVSPDNVCSNNGACLFRDASGNALTKCLITSPFCYANCKCTPGYGGVDCSLDPPARAKREAARVFMCSALLQAVSVSPKTVHLFESVVSALESAFDFTEITSIAGRAECALVLRFAGVLASKGYLGQAHPVSQHTFTEITSQFVETIATNPVTSSRRQLTQIAQFTADVNAALSGITTGTEQLKKTVCVTLL